MAYYITFLLVANHRGLKAKLSVTSSLRTKITQKLTFRKLNYGHIVILAEA